MGFETITSEQSVTDPSLATMALFPPFFTDQNLPFLLKNLPNDHKADWKLSMSPPGVYHSDFTGHLHISFHSNYFKKMKQC